MQDKELKKAIEDWTGHAIQKRIDLFFTVVILFCLLAVATGFLSIIYWISTFFS